MEKNIAQLDKLLKSADNGRILKEGIQTVILGKPNAGKSSLLNVLAGEERAIVTEIEGTTRDTLEESIYLGEVVLNLIDTAGIRKTEDYVEKIGVEKARTFAKEADLIISSERPSFLAMANALERPGIPIDRRYVGFKVLISNSQEAFSTPSVSRA